MKAQASGIVASVVFVMCATAHAGTVVCSGTVDTLSFHASGTGGGLLMIKLSSMNVPVYFCDPDNPLSASGSGYSISPATCKALYATFLTARASGQPISNMYFDGDAVPSTCGGWVTWQSANVRHYLY